MTRFIHDQFAKQYLTELLTPYGQVDMSKDITSEVRQIDVLFTPASPSPDRIETLVVHVINFDRFVVSDLSLNFKH